MPTERNPRALGQTAQAKLAVSGGVGSGSADQGRDQAVSKSAGMDRGINDSKARMDLIRYQIGMFQTYGTNEEIVRLQTILEAQARILAETLTGLNKKR